ncbi:MAG: hypothetical protein ACI9V8_000654 [Urechidicola sp.]|jgi:hypothetical protein
MDGRHLVKFSEVFSPEDGPDPQLFLGRDGKAPVILPILKTN